MKVGCFTEWKNGSLILGSLVEDELEAEEVLEEVGFGGEGEAFGGGVDDSFDVEGGFVVAEGDGEVFDSLGMGAL